MRVAFYWTTALLPWPVKVAVWLTKESSSRGLTGIYYNPGSETPDVQADDWAASVPAGSSSDASGSLARVANWVGEFQLRKLQLLFGRVSGDAAGDDDAVTTIHFLKIAAGEPQDNWVEADFTTIEAAFDTFWNATKTYAPSIYTFRAMRWYKDGPEFSPENPAGPPVRAVTRSVVGGDALAARTPPQVATTLTEKTSDAKSWGRMYLPLNSNNMYGAHGRITSAAQTAIANAADALYEAALGNNTPIVVYSPAKPSRTKKGGGTLPAIGARALGVTQIQVDDLADVIRSRRWSRRLLAVQRDIG